MTDRSGAALATLIPNEPVTADAGDTAAAPPRDGTASVAPAHGQAASMAPVHGQAASVAPVHGQAASVAAVHGQAASVAPVHGHAASVAAVHGVAVVDFHDGQLLFVSDGLADLLGYRPGALRGRSATIIFGDEGEEQIRAIHGGLFDSAAEDGVIDVDRNPAGSVHTVTHTLRHRDGHSLLLHATYTVVAADSRHVLVQYRDLRDDSSEALLAGQPAAIEALHRGRDLGRLCHEVCSQIERELDDGSRCWLGIVSPVGELEPVVTGETSFETVGEIIDIITRSASRPTKRVVSVEGLPAEYASKLRTEPIRSLWYLPLMSGPSDGTELAGALVVVTPRPAPDHEITRRLDQLAAMTASAIERSTNESDLAHQSLHDPLTRLPNRALIVDRLGQAMARLERDGIVLSVLLVDIDRFKTLNDTRGPEVGDRVLLEVAARLLAAVRLGDTVGRISSDQYLVMCVATNGDLDPSAVARRILRSLAEPIAIDAKSGTDQLRITASAGVVVVDEPGPAPAVIIGNAESALRQATTAGRGRFVMFDHDLRQGVLDRHETEQALHRAIAGDELVVHYQPLVEVRTGFIVGAEALIRWARPGHDLLYPGAFIGIAEESDLIVAMGEWIIDRVCVDLARWPKASGRSPMVTINLAARQLAVDTLVPTVISALRRHDLHPRMVGFEITESMEIDDDPAVEVNLARLAELGSRIAIDDFGIGHATLDYLRRFSMAAALKLDRSFVAGLGTSREDSAIVNASIALASSLGLQVIAEGVENMDQLLALHDLGCRYAQGFALARPMPFDDVLALWHQGRLYDGLDRIG